MKFTKKAIIFIVMIAGVLAIPMMYMDQTWGYQVVWIWGMQTNMYGTSSFQPMADVLSGKITLSTLE